MVTSHDPGHPTPEIADELLRGGGRGGPGPPASRPNTPLPGGGRWGGLGPPSTPLLPSECWSTVFLITCKVQYAQPRPEIGFRQHPKTGGVVDIGSGSPESSGSSSSGALLLELDLQGSLAVRWGGLRYVRGPPYWKTSVRPGASTLQAFPVGFRKRARFGLRERARWHEVRMPPLGPADYEQGCAYLDFS